jgi:hypothetical protein
MQVLFNMKVVSVEDAAAWTLTGPNKAKIPDQLCTALFMRGNPAGYHGYHGGIHPARPKFMFSCCCAVVGVRFASCICICVAHAHNTRRDEART